MFSAEDMQAVKLAIVAFNDPELRREVFCAPGSDYYINKTSYEATNKKQWDEVVEKKSAIIIEHLGLPGKLQKKVIKLVPLVGIRMLTWAEYHERTLEFSREYSMKFLTDSFFTSQGIIDNEKAAEVLMKDKDLSIKQKYMLACLYCFTDHIPALYTQMTKEDKAHFYDAQNPGKIKQSGLVKFWSYYYQMGELHALGSKNLDLHLLEKAIESGNKVAVQYCFEKIDLSRKKDALVAAAVDIVRNRIMKRDDWIVFRDQRYDSKETWVPGDYYVDILYFLLSKMTEDQQIHVLKQDTKVLESFLNWPYQNHFMNMAKLMWKLLPESHYAVLLLRICHKIEINYGTLEYGEDGSFDYRGLLTEFWCQSPERCKRYVFNHKLGFRIREGKAVAVILFILLSLKNFTHEDRENINLILASADKEKENITSFEEWKDICIDLIEEEKWEMLDQFVLNWFSSKEEANKFKREMIFTKEVQRICINFVKNTKWNAAESLIRWSAASEEEINNVKKEMIYSEEGKRVCSDFSLLEESVQVTNKFCEWFFSSEDEFEKFKKECILSSTGADYCSLLALKDKIDIADEFAKWCFSSKEKKD